MKTLVLNGWAAEPEIWDLCTFPRDRVFSYLDELNGEPDRVLAEMTDGAILVGFSMGGNYAMKLLLDFPGKVKGLVLVSTTPRMMEERSEGWVGMSERRRSALKFGTVMMNPGKTTGLFDDRNLDAGLDFLQHSDLRARLSEFANSSPSPSPSTSPSTSTSTSSLHLNLPVAIFQSDRDGIVRPHNAAWLKEHAFPQASVTMVPGNDHNLPLIVPGAISAAVVKMQAELAADAR